MLCCSVGVAPQTLQERGCSCKVFSRSRPVCEVLVSAGISNISAGLGGAMCDAPGFQPEYVLTLVKRWSTGVITSKTSPTTPNDTPWSTHGQGWVKTLVKPLEHPFAPSVSRNFCRFLQISPKHFKISQCKSCVFCRGTQLSC
jgi:hypothetical protein